RHAREEGEGVDAARSGFVERVSRWPTRSFVFGEVGRRTRYDADDTADRAHSPHPLRWPQLGRRRGRAWPGGRCGCGPAVGGSREPGSVGRRVPRDRQRHSATRGRVRVEASGEPMWRASDGCPYSSLALTTVGDREGACGWMIQADPSWFKTPRGG